ncbi:MAG: AraC family transcriptional regulator [Bacteroidota bacterium]
MGLKKYWNDIEMKAWSNSAVIFFLVFALSWVIFYIITTSGLYTPEADYIISFAMVLMIGLTTYFGFFHSDVFNGKPLKKIFPAIKYKNSGLSKKVMIDLKEKLSDVITNEQLYLDCELKLIDLADKLNISRHHASQVINESYGVSFYAFINKLRIEEAEKILTDTKYKNLNITDIAFKCGFNNRVSFYNSFRKHVGMTPLDFRSMKMRAAS